MEKKKWATFKQHKCCIGKKKKNIYLNDILYSCVSAAVEHFQIYNIKCSNTTVTTKDKSSIGSRDSQKESTEEKKNDRSEVEKY